MKKVFLRADGNHAIGWGHVSRMIALGEILADDFSVTLLSRDKVDAPIPTLQIQDESAFISLLGEDSIAVLDGYHFGLDFQRAIRQSGAKLVCVDDYQHQSYLADVVINHAPGVREDMIQALPETQYLLGPQYALLRKSFLEPYSRGKTQRFEHAFICFGGSDVLDLSYATAKVLNSIDRVKSITLIVGKDYKGKCKELDNSKLSIFENLDATQMRDMIRAADFGLVSASTLLFECLSQELFCISGYYVNNQQAIYDGFLNQGVISGLGDLTTISKKIIEKKVTHLDDHSKLAIIESIFDGRIKERYISYFNDL
ncbi:MAG: hypothetical protein RIF46_08690 [Cyclobacteriaceae bacterium]